MTLTNGFFPTPIPYLLSHNIKLFMIFMIYTL